MSDHIHLGSYVTPLYARSGVFTIGDVGQVVEALPYNMYKVCFITGARAGLAAEECHAAELRRLPHGTVIEYAPDVQLPKVKLHDGSEYGFSLRPEETDPHGKTPNAPGAKLDAGKPLMSLVIQNMPRAMRAIAEVATYRAQKYTLNGWADVPDGVRRYTDAMLRHVVSEGVEDTDTDSGLLHAAQAAWNAIARLELMLRGENTPA